MLNLQCSYSNTVNLKRTLNAELVEPKVNKTIDFGDLSNRFIMTTMNTDNNIDSEFVIGETALVEIYQEEAIANISFYIESCAVSVTMLKY